MTKCRAKSQQNTKLYYKKLFPTILTIRLLHETKTMSALTSPTVYNPFHDTCGPGFNFSSDFTVHVYGGNVTDAVAYPQWANAGQVLLKVENQSAKKQILQLRTMKSAEEDGRKVYFHAERVHVRDGTETQENFSLLSEDIFIEHEDKQGVDLRVLNDAKFVLNRKPSELKDFVDAYEIGEMLYIDPKSSRYYLLRLTSEERREEGTLNPRKLDLAMRKKATATYFHVDDVEKCVKYTMAPDEFGFSCRKPSLPCCPTASYRLCLHLFTGKNIRHMDSNEDFKKIIYTSDTFRVGKLRLGCVKGFKEVSKSSLAETVKACLKMKTEEQQELIKLYTEDDNYSDEYRQAYLYLSEVLNFILLSGDTETIWKDQWPNVVETNLEKMEKFITGGIARKNLAKKKGESVRKYYKALSESNNFLWNIWENMGKKVDKKLEMKKYLKFHHWNMKLPYKQCSSEEHFGNLFSKNYSNFRAIAYKISKKSIRGTLKDVEVPFQITNNNNNSKYAVWTFQNRVRTLNDTKKARQICLISSLMVLKKQDMKKKKWVN